MIWTQTKGALLAGARTGHGKSPYPPKGQGLRRGRTSAPVRCESGVNICGIIWISQSEIPHRRGSQYTRTLHTHIASTSYCKDPHCKHLATSQEPLARKLKLLSNPLQ